MKEEIVKIIGHGIEPERAELKACEIIMLFNKRILEALKKYPAYDMTQIINDIWIPLS